MGCGQMVQSDQTRCMMHSMWIYALTLLYIFKPLSALPELITTSSPPNGSQVYIQQPITINCRTMNTQVHVWENDEYIGENSQLPITDKRSSSISEIDNNTYAIRTNINDSNIQLESRLHLIVTSVNESFIVTCRNVDLGLADKVIFHVTDVRALDAFLVNETICTEDDQKLDCTAKNSSAIKWSSSVLNDSVLCKKNDPPIRNLTINGVGLSVNTSYNYRTSELICSLKIEATNIPVNQKLSFTCLNVDIGINKTVSFEVLDSCYTTPTSVRVSTRSSQSTSGTILLLSVIISTGLQMLL